MLYALVDGIKSSAIPESIGICPFCEGKMISKCGEFKTWHWAHKQNNSCDSWHEPETEWHRRWKQIFGIGNCEIILTKDNHKHIADIKTNHGRIIELQNSPINFETLHSREQFYGNDMIWIINGAHFAHNFIIKPFHATEYDTYTPEFDRYAKINGFTPTYKSLTKENKERFQWKRPKAVWKHATAKVYIDFGDESIFQVKEGLGLSRGTGISISKSQFIIDNGGDKSLISTFINSK